MKTFFPKLNSNSNEFFSPQPCDSTMISYLLQFLRRPGDPETVEYAAGIFGNLSSDKPRLKEAIFYAGGVDILLQTVRKTERYY